jgi:fermentation-respiration switch protein FrsA (DUF1100 family)
VRCAPSATRIGAAALISLALGGCGGEASPHRDARSSVTARAAAPGAQGGSVAPVAPRTSFTVGTQVLHLVDRSRTIALPGGPLSARTLTTIVRYPAVPGARSARPGSGPFPLVVFAHGFAVTPEIYGRLLDHWARAGFVVAAPVFPLGNRDAPGGPFEPDLVNQPADVTFVISSLLALSRSQHGPLAGLLDPHRIAVAGQSDGGDTALAAAYDARRRDRRVRAAVILSGAEDPFQSSFTFPAGGPALLAVQGTADTINPPGLTSRFFAAARHPKYLLRLPGAGHLGPYTGGGPQAAVVERVTTGFLDRYLRSRPVSLALLRRLADVPGVAALSEG